LGINKLFHNIKSLRQWRPSRWPRTLSGLYHWAIPAWELINCFTISKVCASGVLHVGPERFRGSTTELFPPGN